MRAVLVVPNVALYGWDCYWREDRNCNSLAHGVLHIATEANARGHEVSVCDLRQYGNMDEAIWDILGRNPDVVGCGAMTVDFDILLELFGQIKQLAPDVVTVAGGVHVSVVPDDAKARNVIDYVILGEAEITFCDLLDSGALPERVVRGDSPDLDELLPIDRELVDYRNGELMRGKAWGNKYPYLTVMTARGCPHRCAFCYPVSFTMFGKPRQRSVAHVMNELQVCREKYDFAYIEFIDDMFTLNDKWLEEFVGAYPSVCDRIPFNAATRVDTALAKPRIFEELRRIGLDTVNIGFESGCDRHLRFLGKGTTREMNREAGKFFKNLGVKMVANVMFGLPGETPEETMQTLRMLREIGAEFPSPSYFTPYPGCNLYKEYADALVETDYAKLNRHTTGDKIRGVDYGPIAALVQAYF